MFNILNNLFRGKPPAKRTPMFAEPPPSGLPPTHEPGSRGQTFSKVFRWRLPDGQTQVPAAVEVVGSFSHWQKVALHRDSVVDGWHATVHHIPGNRTHNYMLLVNGRPVSDKNSDGLAVPHSAEEKQHSLETPRGPRVFMLFSQTK